MICPMTLCADQPRLADETSFSNVLIPKKNGNAALHILFGGSHGASRGNTIKLNVMNKRVAEALRIAVWAHGRNMIMMEFFFR